MRWWALLSLLLVSCSRCAGPKPAPIDAGVTVRVPTTHSTDLRTVLLISYPEYRGTNFKSGVARLTRTYSGDGDWSARTRELFKTNRVNELPSADGVEGMLDLFRLKVVPTPGGAVGTISLPVDGETLSRLYTNPASLSTMQLGLYLPRKDVVIARDVFDFDLDYDAVSERRASFLTRQLVELMLGNSQWKVGPLPEGWGPPPGDGGFGSVPDEFTVQLTGVVDGAVVTVKRQGRSVKVNYQLVTFEP